MSRMEEINKIVENDSNTQKVKSFKQNIRAQ